MPENIMQTLRNFVPGAIKATGQFLDPSNTNAPVLGPIRQANFSLFGRPDYANANLPAEQRVNDAAKRYESNFMLHGEPVSPNVHNIHPDDQSVMEEFYNQVVIGKNKNKDLGPIGDNAQDIADHYFGKNWRGVPNDVLAKAFAWALDLNRKVPAAARSKLPNISRWVK